MAVAIGPQLVSADLFDKPATCQKVWGWILSGLVLDALAERHSDGLPDRSQVNQFLHEARNATWKQTQAVGEGQEFRAAFGGKVGSALLLDGALVYGGVAAGLGRRPAIVGGATKTQ